MTKAPIFILGTQRSGTTLLSFILDSHPNIAIGRETLVMRGMHYLLVDDNDPTHQSLKNWYERYGMSRSEFIVYIRDFLNNFFGDYAASQGKKRWGEKTPFHIEYCDLIYEIFPDAQFIHIIRDPRAVCSSLRSWGVSVDCSAREWRDKNRKAFRFGQKISKEQYMYLRYEDLVEKPSEIISILMDFLGEDWHDNLLQHEHIVSRRYVQDGVKKGISCLTGTIYSGKVIVEGGKVNDPKRPIDRKSIDKWQRNLRKVEIKKIQEITRTGMKRFNYKMAYGLIPLIGKVKFKD